MDHQKDDNQNNGSKGHFKDSQGHSLNISHVPERTQGTTKGGNGLSYIVRKTEKLTAAVYLVTDIMAEREPIKWKIREGGLELLSDIMLAVVATTTTDRVILLRGFMKKIEKVVAFLDVARSARIVSEMNITVLRKEYCALEDAVEAELSRVGETSAPILTESFFNVDNKEMLAIESFEAKQSIPAKDIPRHPVVVPAMSVHTETAFFQGQPLNLKKGLPLDGHTETKPLPTQSLNQNKQPPVQNETPKRNVISAAAPTHVIHTEHLTNTTTPQQATHTPFRNAFQNQPMHQRATLGNFESKGLPLNALASSITPAPLPQLPRPIQPPRPFVEGVNRARTDNDRDDRRKIILALLKQKSHLTVKDISKSIPGYSEKTIQRELLGMVSEGTLIKQGERRWSTYSLRVN